MPYLTKSLQLRKKENPTPYIDQFLIKREVV